MKEIFSLLSQSVHSHTKSLKINSNMNYETSDFRAISNDGAHNKHGYTVIVID